jgi:hypothetical protein
VPKNPGGGGAPVADRYNYYLKIETKRVKKKKEYICMAEDNYQQVS